jgi:signal transduction histidine kinase
MSSRAANGLTIKAALLLGFGLTLGVWLFTGYDVTRRMAAVGADAAALSARYTRSQEILSSVRAQALLGSVYVRDALLDPDPTTLDLYRGRLEQAYTGIDRTLQQYAPVVDSSRERQRLEEFRHELADWRATILEVLATDRSRWPTEARTLLNERVMPKREAVIRLSDDVQALNRRAFVQQQAAMAALYADAQRRTWERLGVALGGSLGIALLATLYASRLETRLKRQRDRDLQNARDLQRLSAKLITAQEEERRTIARELHDEVGQVLTAIKMELAAARRSLQAQGIATQPLEAAQSIADGALHTVRDLSRLLHPSVLDDLGLPAAVEAYVQGFRQRNDVRIDLQITGMAERLPSEVEASVYRIIQEALTNVVKHAHATSCHVSLQRDGDTLLLTVEDNGTGFAERGASPSDPRGIGLIGIRERAAYLRGTVRLDRSAAGGARISVDLPVAPPQALQLGTR